MESTFFGIAPFDFVEDDSYPDYATFLEDDLSDPSDFEEVFLPLCQPPQPFKRRVWPTPKMPQ